MCRIMMQPSGMLMLTDARPKETESQENLVLQVRNMMQLQESRVHIG
jgi:hypothetical protein